MALGLSGQKLLGVPIIVQPSHAERNRLASAAAAAMKSSTSGPMRLYVGSLHYNIDEDMLNTIFSPFGKVGVGLNGELVSPCLAEESGRNDRTD